MNLNIKFPLPCERLVWDYNIAETEKFKKSIEQVHWENIFNHYNPHEQVAISHKTIINIFPNFVPKELVTCDDRDLPWTNEFVKNKIKSKNKFCKDNVKYRRAEIDYLRLKTAMNNVLFKSLIKGKMTITVILHQN